jgi:4'-phosphopantetheinyl transferase EntD
VVEASSAMWSGELYAVELDAVRNAVDKRRREFVAGRNCARAALIRLGLPPIPIPVGSDRAPVLPHDISCSITHTHAYCAAAAIVRGELSSVGIDAEERTTCDESLAQMILCGDELAAFARLQPVSFDLVNLAFSAKEAFYKAYHQQMRSWLDFRDVQVAFDLRRRSFRITIMRCDEDRRLIGHAFEGSYAVDAERVYCAIALPALR